MTTASSQDLEFIPLDQIVPSPTNPRKTFDDAKLQELAESIMTKGLIQPIVVRPYPKLNPAGVNPNKNGLPKFEVVAGERRYRASKLAGLRTILCIVRELEDVAVLELQTIENLQRDDLHPLEEAEGYAALMKSAGYDVDQIAAKIGKSAKYVYDRIKLLQLAPELRKVFVEGEISAGHAILLARLSKEDQLRALGEEDDYGDSWHRGGLFEADTSDEGELALDDEREARKAVSVRELQTWINDHVRFRPEVEDLPNLFPETAEALEEAAAVEIKVVKITRDHYIQPEARDEKERTYGPHSWKRADGEIEPSDYDRKKSKVCEHSVLGLVVTGPGRGEAFAVCVAKKKCAVHWKAEQEAANQRGAPNGAGTKKGKVDYAAQRQKEEEQRKQRDRETARWKKARPKMLDELAAAIEKTPAEDLLEELVAVVRSRMPYGAKVPSQLKRGKSLADGIRYAAFIEISRPLFSDWRLLEDAPKVLKEFGIDARKIVDEVAPKPKPEKKKPEASAAPKKKGARARRREKAEATS